MYPKARVDALTDGLFAVAMTLLVLDLRLPDGLRTDPVGLTQALEDLWSKFFPYALSFFILGSMWLANVRVGTRCELLSRRYVTWWLVYLLMATCLPFSTSVVGRFAHLAPALWVYSLNMAVLAAVGYRLVVLLARDSDAGYVFDRKLSLTVLMISSLLCCLVSLIRPSFALFAYALNLLERRLARVLAPRDATRSAASAEPQR
jgi:uncharacterized membrane protein